MDQSSQDPNAKKQPIQIIDRSDLVQNWKSNKVLLIGEVYFLNVEEDFLDAEEDYSKEIFKTMPGLARRVQWNFSVNDPNKLF